MDNHSHSLWEKSESSGSCRDKEQNDTWKASAYLRPAWAHHPRWRASQCMDSPTRKKDWTGQFKSPSQTPEAYLGLFTSLLHEGHVKVSEDVEMKRSQEGTKLQTHPSKLHANSFLHFHILGLQRHMGEPQDSVGPTVFTACNGSPDFLCSSFKSCSSVFHTLLFWDLFTDSECC